MQQTQVKAEFVIIVLDNSEWGYLNPQHYRGILREMLVGPEELPSLHIPVLLWYLPLRFKQETGC